MQVLLEEAIAAIACWQQQQMHAAGSSRAQQQQQGVLTCIGPLLAARVSMGSSSLYAAAPRCRTTHATICAQGQAQAACRCRASQRVGHCCMSCAPAMHACVRCHVHSQHSTHLRSMRVAAWGALHRAPLPLWCAGPSCLLLRRAQRTGCPARPAPSWSHQPPARRPAQASAPSPAMQPHSITSHHAASGIAAWVALLARYSAGRSGREAGR